MAFILCKLILVTTVMNGCFSQDLFSLSKSALTSLLNQPDTQQQQSLSNADHFRRFVLGDQSNTFGNSPFTNPRFPLQQNNYQLPNAFDQPPLLSTLEQMLNPSQPQRLLTSYDYYCKQLVSDYKRRFNVRRQTQTQQHYSPTY
jgi:hypothetical protein